MDRRKLYALASAIGLYYVQDKPSKEMEDVITSFNDDVKELEEEMKKNIVIDDKVANDKYNKEQMKYRKRFHK